MCKSSLIKNFQIFRREPSAESRVGLVTNICTEYRQHLFKDSEQDIVEEILLLLSGDVEKKIRRALSDSLKDCDFVPRNIIKKLANDEAFIAMPVLQFSKVLTDQDLKDIIDCCDGDIDKLSSISKRQNLSSAVSDRIIKVSNSNVVHILINNKTAHISESAQGEIFETFSNHPTIIGALIERGSLSFSVAEKMLAIVSKEIGEKLVIDYGVNHNLVKKISNNIREEVTLDILSDNVERTKIHDFVTDLHKQNKLTHSMVLRSLCKKEFSFLEMGLARLAGIASYNANKLLYSGDKKGFEALFEAAKMPAAMVDAGWVVFTTLSNNAKYSDESNSLYFRRITQIIMRERYDEFTPNMDYFLSLLNNSVDA